MNKQELRALALVGYVAKLKGVEAQLAVEYKMFPEAFIGDRPPQLVRPELRNGHAPGWPIVATARPGKKQPTPDERRQQRAESARLLGLVAKGTDTPAKLRAAGIAPTALRVIGILQNAGYLAKRGEVYRRTRKPFTIDQRKGAT